MIVPAKAEHEAVYQELTNLMMRHAARLTALEVLAIAANIVGKLVAMQDQRTVTPDMAMEIVVQNIESGNRQVIESLHQTVGTA